MHLAPLPPLTALEARVLGVLVEKAHTVPDTYPLSLNALTAGCNQKSSREPVMNARDAEVQTALESLRRHALVVESSGGRVMRYAENIGRALGIPSPSVALLATLALRGPQTVSELKLHSERLYRFADASSVEGFLEELADRAQGALVTQLGRRAGEREVRWDHLLCGAIERGTDESPARAGRASELATADTPTTTAQRLEALEHELAELRSAVSDLSAQVEGLKAER